MNSDVKTRRRRYHSPLRTGQAEQTRRRILDAAFGLFADGGYAGTSVKAIAERADVSAETVYMVFGDKRGLLQAVIAAAIAGPDDAATNEATLAAVADLPGASERLGRLVAYSCSILARTRAIHVVIRGAADTEPFAADLGRRLLRERLDGQTERIGRYLGQDLKPGLSVAEAGQRYCALVSPELYFTLTAELGWTAEQFRGWVTGVLATDLLAAP